MQELFSPQGSNPLANIKISNPRCGKVEFDRTVRSNVMVIEGDLTQSRVQIPKEDRPMSSLQLNHSLVVLQIMIPSSGQFLLELNVSNSPMTRMRLSAATFISRADVVDAKGMAHAKIPLVIPRNCWVQIVFHVGGIFTHLFRLPSVKWIDSVVLAGSCKVRKVMTCADEASAIESKPGGMLLFAVPAYGPPVWQTAGGVPAVPPPQIHRSVEEAQPPADSNGIPPASPTAESASSARSPASVTAAGRARVGHKSPPPRPQQPEVSSRTMLTVTSLNKGTSPLPAQRGQLDLMTDAQVSTPTSTTSDPSGGTPSKSSAGAATASSPMRMRFLKGDDGSISFTASNPEQEANELEERRRQLDIIERLRREAEALRVREDIDKQRRDYEEQEQRDQYVRIVDAPEAPPLVSGRRQTLSTSNNSGMSGGAGVGGGDNGTAARRTTTTGQSLSMRPNGRLGTPPDGVARDFGDDGGFGSWDDDSEQTLFSSMLAGGGVGNNVVQMFNAGGKPIVVPKRAEDAAALSQAAILKSTRATASTKPRVATIRNPTGSPVVARRKKASLPPSMMLLSLRPAQVGDAHPADDYDPDHYRKLEPDVGYGCGYMDVLHGTEEEDEEYEEEEE